MFRDASGLPKFDQAGENFQIIKFGHNVVTTWSGNMILVSNPTKINTSNSLKLSERLKRLRSFRLHRFLLK